MIEFLLWLLIYYFIGIMVFVGTVFVFVIRMSKRYGLITYVEVLKRREHLEENDDTNVFIEIIKFARWPKLIIKYNEFEQETIKEIEEFLEKRV